MSLTTRVGLLAGASALALTGVSLAGGPTEAQSTEVRIAELEAEVARLKGDDWLTEQRAEEIRGLVHDVLADADTRASLLQSGMTAGYDNGFVISSPDGNFLLRINGQLQTRMMYNNNDGGLLFLDQDDADSLFSSEVGFGNWSSGVIGEMDSSQLDDLAVLTDALSDAFSSGPLSLVESIENQIDAFIETTFQGYDSSMQDAVVTSLGLTDDAGDAIETWAAYQSEVSSFTKAAYAASIMGQNNGDNSRHGFENSRTKLWFSGHVVNPQWKYMIEADFGNGFSGDFELRDAYIAYDYGSGWTAMIGQFKAPVLHEELVDSRYQLAVERSLVNSVFTGGRTQGIAMDYRSDQWHFVGSYNDGANSDNTPSLAYDTEYSVTGRAEVLLSGNWAQFDDFTSPAGEETGAMIGAAIHWQQQEFGTGTVPDFDSFSTKFNSDEIEILLATIDASIEFGGGNIYAAFIYRDIDSDVADDFSQYGIIVQGGYYFSDTFEGFVRYEYADFDMPDLSYPGGLNAYSWDDLSVITVGMNHYFSGHQVKWTTDFGYAFDRVEYFAADEDAGYRSDTGGDDGQIVFRSQLQLTF